MAAAATALLIAACVPQMPETDPAPVAAAGPDTPDVDETAADLAPAELFPAIGSPVLQPLFF